MFHPILPLTLDDLPDCLALAQDREWLPEDHKWRLIRLGRPLPGQPFLS